jgi:hypothetical protein
MEVLFALMFLPFMVLLFVFVKKVVQKWFMDESELTRDLIAQSASIRDGANATAIPSSFVNSARQRKSSSEEQIANWMDRTSNWIRSWSTNERAWAPEGRQSAGQMEPLTDNSYPDEREMDRKLKWMQSEYNRLEAAVELKSKMINQRTEQIEKAESGIDQQISQKQQEVNRLDDVILNKRQTINEEMAIARGQQLTIMDQELQDKREEMLSEIEKERYELRKSLTEDNKQAEDAPEFLHQIDDKLQNELENIGRVFTGLANEQMSFNEKDLKILLQNSYFNIMSGDVNETAPQNQSHEAGA